MVKVIVGLMGSSVGKGSSTVDNADGLRGFLDCVKGHNVRELDTARVYNGGKSEEMLGAVQAHERFAVSTKAPAFAPKSLSEENILSNASKSLKALGQEKVDLYYLHGPDRSTPLEEQCRAINKLYQQGAFERFGVSNISDAEVQEIYDICKREGYPLPAVYQGGYNPISRAPEKTLFPLLKKLGMNFYAFSPLAGGLLAKKVEDVIKPAPGSRFDEMKVFGDIYLKEEILAALENLQGLCDENGISLLEATLRWFMHHSPMSDQDGVILGASTTKQIDASLTACEKGPLPNVLVKQWDDTWEAISHVNTRYHS